MNLLVTGSNGQLGSELQQLSEKHTDINFIFTDIETLDITNLKAIEQFVVGKNIDFIINCAAYTNVDKAEEDAEAAYLLNATAVGYLAQVAAKIDAILIHISTDYVFSGIAYKPYVETDDVAPNTAYGKSKLKGEELVQKYCSKYIIIRTAWLYSPFGKNFLKTMLALGKEKTELGVVADQIGTPTYAYDLAAAIVVIIGVLHSKNDDQLYGIYHFTNEGVCSWYDFSVEIQHISENNCRVKALNSSEFVTKTPRPYYSVLNKSKIKDKFGIEICHWHSRIEHCINRLKK